MNGEVDANKSAEALLSAQQQAAEAHAAVAAKSAQLADLRRQLEEAQSSEQATQARVEAGRTAKEEAAKKLQVPTMCLLHRVVECEYTCLQLKSANVYFVCFLTYKNYLCLVYARDK